MMARAIAAVRALAGDEAAEALDQELITRIELTSKYAKYIVQYVPEWFFRLTTRYAGWYLLSDILAWVSVDPEARVPMIEELEKQPDCPREKKNDLFEK